MTTQSTASLDNNSEEKDLRHYEMLYIIPVKYTVEELPDVQNKIKNLLSERGCSLTYEEDLGKRKLAYPIKHVYHGYYFVAEFNMDSAELRSLNNSLSLLPDVLRHLIITKKQKTKEEMAAERERRERAEVAEVEALKGKIEAQTPKLVKEREPEAEKKSTAKGKVSIEDLDKKLDELIDESIL